MSDEELAKDLGPLAALTIGVGTMIGAGIFVLPGVAVQQAGSLAVGAFVVGGVIAMFTAMSASELGTAMPKSGGAYFYVNHALGPLFGSVAGWSNWLGLAFASAFYMVGFGQYIQAIVGIEGTLLAAGPVTITVTKLVALAGGAFFIGVNYVGAKETGRLQNVIVVVLVVILAVFTVIGALRADPANLPPNKGFSNMMITTGLIFVSYLGFVQITSVAEEIKEPGKNLPRAVIGSVLLVTAIYALVLIVMSAAVEPGFIAAQQEAGNKAIVEAATLLLGPVGGVAMLFGGLLATASSANASILASSRINFAMGRDGIVSDTLNEVHPRFSTPYRSIAITGALILVFILFGTVETLSTMGSVLHLVIYALLNVALIVMREADASDYDPDFTIPLYPAVPVLGAVLSTALIVFIDPVVIGLSFAIVGGAVVWYFGYARTRATKRGVAERYIAESDRIPTTRIPAASPDGGSYRIMVPLANPEHESTLITLASAIAKQRDGVVDAVHIVTVPDQTSLSYGADHVEELDAQSEQLLQSAREDARTFDVPVETHTIISHESFEEIFDAAADHDADLVIMGRGPHAHGAIGRAEGTLDEMMEDLPCDFLVFRDRGFDPSKILVPTAGGPDSDLSAEIAALLRAEYDADIELLHVAEDRAAGEQFLESWAGKHNLDDATLTVETGDVETAIETAADACTLVILGATERGLLRRLVQGSVIPDVVEDVPCSVLLAETSRHRSLFERLFG